MCEVTAVSVILRQGMYTRVTCESETIGRGGGVLSPDTHIGCSG